MLHCVSSIWNRFIEKNLSLTYIPCVPKILNTFALVNAFENNYVYIETFEVLGGVIALDDGGDELFINVISHMHRHVVAKQKRETR